MNIRKVHCLFEQSGTFKNEFIKFGYSAEDYDIQNVFGQTDNVIDIFDEIEKAYQGEQSMFDNISHDDLVLAFFPCIYFETMQMVDYQLCRNDTEKWSVEKKVEYAMDRLNKRTRLHTLLYKLTAIFDRKKVRWVLENPATEPNYLITGQNYPNPTIVDKDRTKMGDYFSKPTGYWFWNFKPKNAVVFQKTPEYRVKLIKYCARSNGDGLCSMERSSISPNYARNWIKKYILGINDFSNMELFKEDFNNA